MTGKETRSSHPKKPDAKDERRWKPAVPSVTLRRCGSLPHTNQRAASAMGFFPSQLQHRGDINTVQFTTHQYAKQFTKQLPSLSPAAPPSQIYPNSVYLSHIPGHSLLQIPILSDPVFHSWPSAAAFEGAWGIVSRACAMGHVPREILWREKVFHGQTEVTCSENANTRLSLESLASL